MMFGELYQYFVLHKQLNIPGIGTFLLERKPATSDFPNRLIHPPSYQIALQENNVTPPKNFYNWLSQVFGISEREAVIRFNDFVYDIKQELGQGHIIYWHGIGKLSPSLGGGISFDPDMNGHAREAPVKAVKVIRDRPEHTVRVGEDEKTAEQMMQLLKQPVSRKSQWWAWALVALVVIIMFLGWYFSAYGLHISSTGNKQPLKTEKPVDTYKRPS
jgi:hypothetical protein